MYERFSDRARKVMQLSNQAAQKLSHEYIGTEHIILGIIGERQCTAVMVLESLGVNPGLVENEVLLLVKPGPECVTMGKLPQTPRAKAVIEFAMDFARTWEHNYVGTEHILLGLMREEEGVACQVLKKLGLTLDKVRENVLGRFGKPAPKADTAKDVTKETHAFMLTVPFWNLDASKSAVESARCVVTAMSRRKENADDLNSKELACYNSALEVLAKQMAKAVENCD